MQGIHISSVESHKTLIMVNEVVNNPHDPTKDRFARLEAQVVDINHNVRLLMVDLTNKVDLFRVYGGYSAKVLS